MRDLRPRQTRAMSLPPGFLDDLRNRVSLSAVVGRKVTWDMRKSNMAKGDWWAPCPFHQEKSASFHVDDRKGFYYCFGCHAKGDALTFVKESENLSFLEALARLQTDRAHRAELAEAEQDVTGLADEGLTWRLTKASEARARASRGPKEQKGETVIAPNGVELDREELDRARKLLDSIDFSKGSRRSP